MKHLIYIFVAVILVMFAACDKNDKNVNETEKVYSDEEILAAVRFVGQGGLGYDDFQTSILRAKAGEVTIIRCDIGRKSKNCSGFGICSVQIGPWKPWNAVADNAIVLPYDGSLDSIDLSEIELLLAEKAGIDMRDVSFSVDENIEIVDISSGISRGTVAAQKVAFSEGIGEHGGFSLSVK